MTGSPGSAAESFSVLRSRLNGLALPGGTFHVAGHERWLSHEAMQSPAVEAPFLHPVWILLGGLRGMGLTLEALMDLARPGPGDTTLLGETEVEQHVPLRADVDYTVTGSVAGLTRKKGQRSGTLDIMTVRLEISEPVSGELVAASRQAFLITRRADAGS